MSGYARRDVRRERRDLKVLFLKVFFNGKTTYRCSKLVVHLVDVLVEGSIMKKAAEEVF